MTDEQIKERANKLNDDIKGWTGSYNKALVIILTALREVAEESRREAQSNLGNHVSELDKSILTWSRRALDAEEANARLREALKLIIKAANNNSLWSDFGREMYSLATEALNNEPRKEGVAPAKPLASHGASETPETDAIVKNWTHRDKSLVDFARKLERERNAAIALAKGAECEEHAQVMAAKSEVDRLRAQIAKVTNDRDEWKDTSTKHLDHIVARALLRDEALAAERARAEAAEKQFEIMQANFEQAVQWHEDATKRFDAAEAALKLAQEDTMRLDWLSKRGNFAWMNVHDLREAIDTARAQEGE